MQHAFESSTPTQGSVLFGTVNGAVGKTVGLSYLCVSVLHVCLGSCGQSRHAGQVLHNVLWKSNVLSGKASRSSLSFLTISIQVYGTVGLGAPLLKKRKNRKI